MTAIAQHWPIAPTATNARASIDIPYAHAREKEHAIPPARSRSLCAGAHPHAKWRVKWHCRLRRGGAVVPAQYLFGRLPLRRETHVARPKRAVRVPVPPEGAKEPARCGGVGRGAQQRFVVVSLPLQVSCRGAVGPVACTAAVADLCQHHGPRVIGVQCIQPGEIWTPREYHLLNRVPRDGIIEVNTDDVHRVPPRDQKLMPVPVWRRGEEPGEDGADSTDKVPPMAVLGVCGDQLTIHRQHRHARLLGHYGIVKQHAAIRRKPRFPLRGVEVPPDVAAPRVADWRVVLERVDVRLEQDLQPELTRLTKRRPQVVVLLRLVCVVRWRHVGRVEQREDFGGVDRPLILCDNESNMCGASRSQVPKR
mmetsp:Transcript_52917/g.118755  ORF Transcript_52917/g.118755 Transcript_52917/m.118755 type:complete len:365 (-) Transcript_52917:892-1986(-)